MCRLQEAETQEEVAAEQERAAQGNLQAEGIRKASLLSVLQVRLTSANLGLGFGLAAFKLMIAIVGRRQAVSKLSALVLGCSADTVLQAAISQVWCKAAPLTSPGVHAGPDAGGCRL